MTTKLLTIFTRTPLHVGCGSSVGAVDQPVARERHTGFPVIPGSAIKGVLADLWNETVVDPKDANGKRKIVRSKEGCALFGNDDTKNPSAGKLLVGEGKLLAFPVRSAKGAFAWLTCPCALNRFTRDTDATFQIPTFEDTTSAVVAQDSALCLKGKSKVVFEEYPLTASATLDAALVDAFKKLSDDPVWQNEVATHLAVVSDELFQYFAENACEIAQHNRIDDETGVVANGALFSQENVPSETIFYSVMNAQEADPLAQLESKLNEEKNLLQIGADVTTGLGWCTVAMKEVK